MRSKTEDDTMKNPRWPHQKPEMTGPETVFDKTEKYSYEAAKYEQAYKMFTIRQLQKIAQNSENQGKRWLRRKESQNKARFLSVYSTKRGIKQIKSKFYLWLM